MMWHRVKFSVSLIALLVTAIQFIPSQQSFAQSASSNARKVTVAKAWAQTRLSGGPNGQPGTLVTLDLMITAKDGCHVDGGGFTISTNTGSKVHYSPKPGATISGITFSGDSKPDYPVYGFDFNGFKRDDLKVDNTFNGSVAPPGVETTNSEAIAFDLTGIINGVSTTAFSWPQNTFYGTIATITIDGFCQ